MIKPGNTYNTTAGDTVTIKRRLHGIWTAVYNGDPVHITDRGRIVGKGVSLLFNDNPEGIARKKFTIVGADSK